MSGVAIRASGLSKRYTKIEERAMLLRSILPVGRPKRHDHWALRDVNLSVAPGETLGVIGRNGAGKTTLLRLLAAVSRPTEGTVEVRGRVAPLISVGVGFHSEMSGRENVYINGMLLGLTRAEIDARFEQIVGFSELEDFIDTPVKFYSSGMFMRLGFAVAIHVDPDILLVDEILAVGDIAFQLKCYERMREVQEHGTTVVCVSHNMHVIRMLCSRAIVMRSGKLEFDGDAGEAIVSHYEGMADRTEDDGPEGTDEGHLRVTDRMLIGTEGPTTHPILDERVTYTATLEFRKPVQDPQFVFHVRTQDGTRVYELRTLAGDWRSFEPGETTTVEIPFEVRLGGDCYEAVLAVTDRDGSKVLHEDVAGLRFYVAPQPGTQGISDLRAAIQVEGEVLSDYPGIFFGAERDPGAGRRSD